MIKSAQEFVDLRKSVRQEDYLRAAREMAQEGVWEEVLAKFPDMKVWVVRNKTVPLEILERLASDPDPHVRAAVALKNKLSRELMEILSNDVDITVRQRIIYNKNVAVELLERLAMDPDDFVSASARERLKFAR